MSSNIDIYRGGGAPPQDRLPTPAPSFSSHSMTSSTSSFPGGRLGALAAKVELAISRWARNVRRNSADSTDSASTVSSASTESLPRSHQLRRRRRRASISSLRTLQSERDIAAHITRLKALEKSREIQRMFTLYLPPSILPVDRSPSGLENDNHRRVTTSETLPTILGQLEAAMHKISKIRRIRNKSRPPAPIPSSLHTILSKNHATGIASTVATPSPSAAPPSAVRRGRKGKHREASSHRPMITTPIPEEPMVKPQAWFLDVANPTWADLRALGKLLHIHPLTLEDVLQRDPREKLENFSKLGYYFVSFRTMESRAARERLQRTAANPGIANTLEENYIGEANVYLTVFSDGICCFHYTDVSEHTDRVRNRIVLLEEVVNMSSDWIAYDILDSVVDSFFPFLEHIEKEVMAIESIVFSEENASNAVSVTLPSPVDKTLKISMQEKHLKLEKTNSSQDTNISPEISEKPLAGLSEAAQIRESFRPRFAAPRPSLPIVFRHAKRFFSRAWKPSMPVVEPPPSAIQIALRRMARTRKLVTTLGRLLATKTDVVTQIQKRLMRSVGNERKGNEEFDIAIYMGDIQDHILTLQHSLAHYERVLSESHPTYLAQLRADFETATAKTDMNLLYLTVVSISVLCLQTLTGLFSMNITLPHNLQEPSGRLNVFGVVLTLAVVIITTYISFVRHWWRQAKRKHMRRL